MAGQAFSITFTVQPPSATNPSPSLTVQFQQQDPALSRPVLSTLVRLSALEQQRRILSDRRAQRSIVQPPVKATTTTVPKRQRPRARYTAIKTPVPAPSVPSKPQRKEPRRFAIKTARNKPATRKPSASRTSSCQPSSETPVAFRSACARPRYDAKGQKRRFAIKTIH